MSIVFEPGTVSNEGLSMKNELEEKGMTFEDIRRIKLLSKVMVGDCDNFTHADMLDAAKWVAELLGYLKT